MDFCSSSYVNSRISNRQPSSLEEGTALPEFGEEELEPDTDSPSVGSPSLLHEALFLASLGQRVLPLNGKVPLLGRGLKEATTNHDSIEGWWGRWPGANVGMVLGDLLVIDDDNPKHGGSTLATDLLEAPSVITPSGGTHHYFQCPKGFRRRLGLRNIDFLTGEGYVLMPPSSIGTRKYRWRGGLDSSCLINLEEPPTGWLSRYTSISGNGDQADLSLCAEGNRNNSLYTLGSRLLAFGYPEDMVETMIDYTYQTMPGELEEGEVTKVMHSLRRYATRSRESMWTRPLDRFSKEDLDDKIAKLCGVLRGANAGRDVIQACIYAMISCRELLFEPDQQWVERRLGYAACYSPTLCAFLRRNGRKDRWWGGK